MSADREAARVRACLKGLAIGDAVGKQTENLSRRDLLRWYPEGIRGFEGAPGTIMPRYAANRKHQWRFGETTDDTERTLAVARAILRDRDVHHASVGRELLRCQKSVHPGVQSLWEFHQAGDAARIAHRHDGCGAAIRVSPVGILYRSHRLPHIVSGAHQASISTHGGPLALAAAAATAAAVSAAIDGRSAPEILDVARRAAEWTEQEHSGDARFARALRTLHQDLSSQPELRPEEIAGEYAPIDPLTIVPLAIVLGILSTSADAAILLAANIGGDSDSVASVAGAIAGARHPESINEDHYQVIEMVNAHGLTQVAEALTAVRF